MKSKKGISLIVLVITIVVIIILAAAVLLSINNNNPFDNAKEAVSENDKDETQSAINLLLGNIMADIHESVKIEGTDAEKDVKVNDAKVVTSSGASVYYDTENEEYTLTKDSNTEVTLSADTLDIDEDVLNGLYITSKGKVVFEADATKASE